MEPPLYQIEGSSCERCLHGHWIILGPDGVDIGITFFDEDDAEVHLEILLRGAAAERERIRRELLEVECICFSLACTGDFGGECAGSLDAAEYFTVEVHDPRCAAALAVRICPQEP